MKVRAKMVVQEISRNKYGTQSEMNTVKMHPVYQGKDPDSENSKFWEYTPVGKLELGSIKKDIGALFEIGKEYYIDISPAE